MRKVSSFFYLFFSFLAFSEILTAKKMERSTCFLGSWGSWGEGEGWGGDSKENG